MTRLLSVFALEPTLVLTPLFLAYGCSDTATVGGSDAASEVEDVVDDPWTPDGPCTVCDDGDPCTLDLCNVDTGECVSSALDADGDGHISAMGTDGITSCGGDDCDDTRADTYPGAEEICLDGVDQDCDTIVDGPRAMLSTVHLKTLADGISPKVAWTGSEFVVIWAEAFSVFLGRVGLDGELVEEPGALVTSTLTYYPAIAWSGSEIGIVYDDYRTYFCSPDDVDCYSNIRFVRVSSTGDLVGSDVRLNDQDTEAWMPDIVWTGSEYGVFWLDGRDGPCATHGTCESDSYFTRIGPDGSEIGTEQRVTDSPTATGPPVGVDPVWNGDGYSLAWLRFDGTAIADQHLTIVDVDGVVESDTLLDQIPRGLSWATSRYGIVWHEDGTVDTDVYLGFHAPSGEAMGEPVLVTGKEGHQAFPAITWTGSIYGVAWLDGAESDCTAPPWLWLGDCHAQIHMSILDADGAELWAPIQITTRDIYKERMQLLWTGSEFGIAWLEGQLDPTPEFSISFDRISFCE